jgi:hypothetical protein
METGYCLKFIRESCYDVPEVLSNCNRLDRLLGEIITECETENVSEDASSFNPDPFSIGSLTPFPVADRAVSDALCDIENAETDDEMLEALINFGRISKVINESYYVMEGEDGSEVIVQEDLGKVARKAETKANKKFAKKAEKDKSKGVKAAVKHATDPMVKFVENKYNKLKEADAEERKRIVMQGGAATGTIYKIWRWVKRSIPLIIGGVVGQYVPVVAIITGISLIGMIASDKSLDKRERAKIMRELEDEIKIVNEKIEDARGDDNKQKRYELMRIRNNLERQRDRIRYNLKY